MSAIQLLEQLGASSQLQRAGSAQGAMIRDQALAAMNELEQPITQWCVVAPAEEEGEDGESKDDDNEEKPADSITLN